MAALSRAAVLADFDDDNRRRAAAVAVAAAAAEEEKKEAPPAIAVATADHRPASVKEESVLAQCYVPHSLRRVNETGASVVVAAKPPQFLEQEMHRTIREGLVPFYHGLTTEELERVRPLRKMQQDDLHAAVLARLDKLHGKKKEKKKKNWKQIASNPPPPPPPLRSIDDVTTLYDYCKTFEKLLAEERKELLWLYERYSQYGVPLTAAPDTAGTGHPPDGQPQPPQHFSCMANIPSIADANPPLQPGDAFLARTLTPIHMPSQIPTMRALSSGFNTPSDPQPTRVFPQPTRVLEVRCLATRVLRQGGGSVCASWVDPYLFHHILQNNSSGLFNLRFVPSERHLFCCLSALDWARQQPEQALMPLLFPTDAPILPLEDEASIAAAAANPNTTDTPLLDDDPNKPLNVHQAEFVRVVLRRALHAEFETVRSPSILTGPAGTGKTKAMLHAILQLLSLSSGSSSNGSTCATYRILVCTPSHTAADVITRRLGQHPSMTQQTLFRMYASHRPVETVPVSVLQFCRQSAPNGAFALPFSSELMQFRVIVCTCEDAHLLYHVGLTNQQLRIRRRRLNQQLQQQCNVTNLEATLGGIDEPHFTHLFLDEAAQATEPESLIPLSVVVDPEPGSRKVEIALVGDPRQLSPNVYSRTALDLGLGRSWMERLLLRPVNALGGGRTHMLGPEMINMMDWIQCSFRSNLSIFLTQNYRGHPSFLMMPSALFYYDKLQSSFAEDKTGVWIPCLRSIECLANPVQVCESGEIPKEIVQKKQFDWPFHFRGVDGIDTSVKLDSGFSSNTWSNDKEAQAVVDIVVAIVSAQEVSTESIGVMAPFRGQVVLIRKLLREKNLGNVNVGTIEDYQAVERDVIVLSLTRSTHAFVAKDIEARTGVFGQPKRSNVALTRAEHLLVVVGNPSVMTKDFVWRQFLLFCLRNGLFYGDTGGTDEFLQVLQSLRSISCRPERRVADNVDNDDESYEDVVVISSIERSHRGS